MQRCIVLILLAVAFAGTLAGAAPRKSGITRLKVPVLAPPDVAIALQDVRAHVETTPAKVVAVASPAQDLILMVILDLAGDLTVLERAKSALLSEIEELPSQVHVAVLRAQDGLRVIQDPGRDRAGTKAAIESLSVGSRAGLLDSIETAAAIGDSILAKSAVRVAILYITDSDVTNYREDFTNPVINSSDAGDLSRKFPEALVQEKISKIDAILSATQVPVFIVHVSYRSDRLNEAYLNGLRQLAITTGAVAVICRSNAEIPAAIKDMLGSITNHYSVTVELPKVRNRSVDVRLTFAAPDGEERELAYRSRFAIRKE